MKYNDVRVNSCYDIDQRIRIEKEKNIENILEDLYYVLMDDFDLFIDYREIAQSIMKHADEYKSDSNSLKDKTINSILQYDKDFEKYIEDSEIEKYIQNIIDSLSLPDEEICRFILGKKLNLEFNGQVNNIFSETEGEIALQVRKQTLALLIKDNTVCKAENIKKLRTEAIYFDDPFVLDQQGHRRDWDNISYNLNHKMHLESKLFSFPKKENVINEMITANKFEEVYSKINSICGGDIVKKSRMRLGYKDINTNKVLDIKNVSTGLKTFVILKTLLMNGALEAGGTIILDEPEIHLHPEWQLLFAELIVLMQKEFGMHILLNTHSPYFLNAIEVYAARYGIADKCKYYLASLQDGMAYMEDVTTNIETIYSKLARPLQKLENERYSDD